MLAKNVIGSVNIQEKNNTHKTENNEMNIENRIFVAKNVNLLSLVNEIDFINEVLLISSNDPPKYNKTAPTIPIVIAEGIIHAEGNRYPKPTIITIGINRIDIAAGDLNKVLNSWISNPFIKYRLLYKYLSSCF